VYKIENLINKYSKSYICFYNLFLPGDSWNKGQSLRVAR